MFSRKSSQKPFVEICECSGTLFSDRISESHLQVEFVYSFVEQNRITGRIFGTVETYNNLVKLISDGILSLSFRSLTKSATEVVIECETILLDTVTRERWGTNQDGEPRYLVATLDPMDFRITTPIRREPREHRYLKFYMAGPQLLWRGLSNEDWSSDENHRTRIQFKPIEDKWHLPNSIVIRLEEFEDKGNSPDGYQVKTSLISVEIREDETTTSLSDDELLVSGRELVDDLSLLISFATRRWTSWIRYLYASGEKSQSYMRQTRQCSKQDVDDRITLLYPSQVSVFVSRALPKMRELRRAGTNMFMPILYYVSACEAIYTEERFAFLFLCLEKLKDSYASASGLSTILRADDIEYENLENAVRNAIKDNVTCSQHREMIYKKIRELNRPSMKTVLQSMFENYSTSWDDLYPDGTAKSLIQTRDALFHSSKDIDVDLLDKETHRLRSLVERIMLAMLSYRSFSRSPEEHVRRWLVQKN